VDTFTYTATDGALESSEATVTVTVREVSETGTLIITCDNGYTVYVNGTQVGSGSNWNQSQTYTIDVADGKNVIAVRGTDAGGVAALLAELTVSGERSGTSTACRVSTVEETGWQEISFDDSGWAYATDYGAYGTGVWGTRVAGMPTDTPAHWIWSSNNDADNVVYVRFTVGEGGGNTPPVAADDAASTDEDTAVTIDVLANDTDADGDALAVSAVTQGANGAVTSSGTDVTYVPNEHFNGEDSFTYTAEDGNGGQSTATVTVTVTSVNDPPVAVAVADVTSGRVPLTVNFDGSGSSDIDGTIVDYEWDLDGESDYGAQVTYTFTDPGVYTVTLYVFDDEGAAGSDSLTITVTANTPPVAQDQAVTTDEDAAKTITLVATDADGDALTYSIVSEPGYGMLTGTPPNMTYEPDGDYYGQDSFLFRANDGYGDSNIATVTITVAPVNDAPVARDGSAATTADMPVDVTLSAYDVDEDALTFVIASAPAHGAITGDDGDALVTYTPEAGFAGEDSFTFVASDGVADSGAATVTVTVTDELVEIVSVSTGKPYSLATAQVDALYYIDRNYRITSLDPSLDGMVLVRTANNDKRVTEPDHLVLRLGLEAVVSVCYDRRWTALPSWLDDGTWTYKGDGASVTDSGASPMEVFEKTFPAGELTLGGNLSGGAEGAKSNYIVIVRPAAGSGLAAPKFTVGPLAADEWLNDGDSDGDGLLDSFEIDRGLDPDNADTDADGIADEAETDVDGTDLWDVQEELGTEFNSVPDSGDGAGGGGSGGGCFIGTGSIR